MGLRTILFLHQNFPAQFRHLSAALAADGRFRIVALGISPRGVDSRIEHHLYDPLAVLPHRQMPSCHPWLAENQTKAVRAEAVQRAVQTLQDQEVRPDLVIGHTGWGELLALRSLLPDTPILAYPEFFHHLQGADTNFDPEFPCAEPADAARLAFRNALQLLDLHQADWCWVPTWWQWSLFPETHRSRFSVIHEGIDTDSIRPSSNATFRLERAGLSFAAGDELVTFVSRTLEPQRGFHVFMRSLPHLQRLRPHAHVLVVGAAAGLGYGAPPPQGFHSWKAHLLHHLGPLFDARRLHFLPHLPHGTLHEVLRVSAAHVYLTVPFVLSWSLLEAMACGAPIVASDTPPVREVIRDGIEGRLVDFLDPVSLARTIAEMLADPERHRRMGKNARRRARLHYDLTRICLPRQLSLVETLLERRTPAPPQPPKGIENALFQPPRPLLQPRPTDTAPATAPASPWP